MSQALWGCLLRRSWARGVVGALGSEVRSTEWGGQVTPSAAGVQQLAPAGMGAQLGLSDPQLEAISAHQPPTCLSVRSLSHCCHLRPPGPDSLALFPAGFKQGNT